MPTAGTSGGTPGRPDLLRVLVVDDNVPVLEFLVDVFAANGCLVASASTAEEALDLLSDRPCDLLIADIKLPGLSGLDLLRAAHGKQPGATVVLITGQPSVTSAVFGVRHRAYDYLAKPISVKDCAAAPPAPPARSARRPRARCPDLLL